MKLEFWIERDGTRIPLSKMKEQVDAKMSIKKKKVKLSFLPDTKPSSYIWDVSKATKKELLWLQKCLKKDKFIQP